MRFFEPSSKAKINFKIPLFDLFWLISSPFIALFLRNEEYINLGNFPFEIPVNYQYAFVTIFCSLTVFKFMKIGESLTHLFSANDLIRLITAVLISVLASVYFVFTLSRLDGVARSVPVIYGLVLLFGLVASRVIFQEFNENRAVNLEKTDFIGSIRDPKRVIIIGLDYFSINTIKLIDSQRPRTVQIVAVLSINGRYSDRTISGVKILGSYWELAKVLDEYLIHGVSIDEVWISDNTLMNDSELIGIVSSACDIRGVECKKVSQALGLTSIGLGDNTGGGVKHEAYVLKNKYYKIKRFFDVSVAIILLLLLSPFYFCIALALIYEIGFPVLFWQERIGKGGRKFFIYKFRSLKNPISPVGKVLGGDERVSVVGSFLRKYRLDEYPQLLNIIVGEMSGIGPRPFLKIEQPNDITIRCLVLPGISGWAQIHGGDHLSFEEKNILDIYYVFNASLFLDLKIFYKSILVLINGVKRDEVALEQARSWISKNKDLLETAKLKAFNTQD